MNFVVNRQEMLNDDIAKHNKARYMHYGLKIMYSLGKKEISLTNLLANLLPTDSKKGLIGNRTLRTFAIKSIIRLPWLIF